MAAAAHALGPFPVRLEEITSDFLSGALSGAFPGAAVKDFKIDEVHRGFSTVLRVHLDGVAGSQARLPKTVMLKGGFESGTRKRARDYTVKSFHMELDSYRVMKPMLGLNMPTVHFADYDSERLQMIILMEDLAARGVRFSNGLQPYTPEQVRKRLTSLAELHAKTWASPELEEGGAFACFPRNGAGMFAHFLGYAGYDRAEWYRYIAMPRGMAFCHKFHDYDWLIRAINYCAKLADETPSCLVHGDTHLSNLYEDPDGAPGYFDALPRREPGMLEATYHICNALDPMDRRQHDRDLVAHYRNELAARGVDVPSLDEMMYQFAIFVIVNYVTFAVNETSYQTESFNTAHAMRANHLMLDHDTYELVNAAT